MESPRNEDDIMLDVSTPRDSLQENSTNDGNSSLERDSLKTQIQQVVISEHTDGNGDANNSMTGEPKSVDLDQQQEEVKVKVEFTSVVVKNGDGSTATSVDKDMFTDILTSEAISLEPQNREEKEVNGMKKTVLEEEGDEAVNLENILIKEKKEETDTDSEFDFELPPLVQQTSSTTSMTGTTSQVTDTVTQAGQQSIITTHIEAPVITQATVSLPTATTTTTGKPVAIIKPTSAFFSVQSPAQETGGAHSDTEQRRILATAQAEWDNVTTIQAGYAEKGTTRGPEPTVVATAPLISSHEIMQHFQSTDFSSVRPSIRTSIERRGFSSFIHLLFGPPRLNKRLHSERDLIFCIAASNLVNENMTHIRTLQTIYRCLTGSKFDCPRSGSHWEEIGFQGNDPSTDLRGTGLLGLVNLLFLLREPKTHGLVSEIFKLSVHPTQNFPFCVMGINLTRIVLQILREDLLNRECNKRHEVMSVVNDLYVGLYLQLFLTWKQGKTISDSGYILKGLEAQAKKNPQSLLKNLDEYLHKKRTVIAAEPMLNSGGDNFLSVCDD